MYKLRLLLCSSWLILGLLSILCCGNSHGQLKSIVISPPLAAGQAQFTASGVYSDGTKVSNLRVLWSEGNPWVTSTISPQGIVVNPDGMASCDPVVGTFPVQATAPKDPRLSLSQMDVTTPQVHGTAQLSCP